MINIDTNEFRIFTAPRRFGIIVNTEPTYSYFNEVLKYIKEKNKNTRIIFDLKNCSYVGIDAILYILSMVIDINNNKDYNIQYSISMPTNKLALNYLKKSGLYDYLENENYKNGNNNLGINRGNVTDQDVADQFKNFAKNNCEIDEESCSEIYELIIELMINTLEHAAPYEDGVKLTKEWYAYCEQNPKFVQIYFLDTGVGIPQSIRDKYPDLISHEDTDADLIDLSIEGKFQIGGRGNGLPHIKTLIDIEKNISKIDVCSRNGMVTYARMIENSNKRIQFDFENIMYGSLIHIMINRKMEEEDVI